MSLKRKLGFVSIFSIVLGNIIGSGIFFTPGELAAVAEAEWQVYFFWALCGFIVLCGSLTFAELSILLPRPGVMYHSLNEAYGPFAGFFQGWIQILVVGPASIAGTAIFFGELANQVFGIESNILMLAWGVMAIAFFALINLRGIEQGGNTQIIITAAKTIGILALIIGAIFFANPVEWTPSTTNQNSEIDLWSTMQFIGLGVGIVLFTYDGWADASHLAGEVKNPRRNLPSGLILGVVGVTAIYLLINYAFLNVMSLEYMRDNPTIIATTAAEAAFGSIGVNIFQILIGVSIFGALGGLVLSIPRLFYATVSDFNDDASKTFLKPFFKALSYLSPKTGVPSGSIIYSAAMAVFFLLFFGTFSEIVTFLMVPLQFINILVVSSIFKLRPRLGSQDDFKTPLYPLVPCIFILTMSILIISALIYNTEQSLYGIILSLTSIPAYLIIKKARDGK
ncbi:APC family permease [Pseudemcibacter aquimaris]|uniref:APC family permease n=1 Tax=Pseudemcibacter aquimaris TaxID=2857064 RepID=UPI002010FE29|nr:amino acid permease [Pseudemcibacter aquimaris]MCC3860322.1 amino acid permease [Pseudemcibacter aquimaris]WDU57648.1 amino acid permease [Pseudemcibacter aquimaris]